VFAAGDVATMVSRPLPKAGVFAVGQGPSLAENLRRHLAGEPLLPYRPQQRFLSLISTGDRHTVASYGALSWLGRRVWAWKDFIDRAFMRKYRARDRRRRELRSQSIPEAGWESPSAPACASRVSAEAAGASTSHVTAPVESRRH
jgi:selenide,water dikinase